jgi:hypothetical protein
VLIFLSAAAAASCSCLLLQVLGFLNQKRPVDVDRESVYLQADAFAALVQMDFVAADGETTLLGCVLFVLEMWVLCLCVLRV